MGKKSKVASSNKLKKGKIDPATLPEDKPPPVEEEVGSSKLLDKPQTPGSIRQVLGAKGYDDGGVGDLRLSIDLEDYVLRRMRGETAYFTALKNDLIPRIKEGNYKMLPRKEQKIELAKMLFHEEGDEEIVQDAYKSVEIYNERVAELDEETKKKCVYLLRTAKTALHWAIVLREPACISLCLAKVCERYLHLYGKEGAEDALRCGLKAIEICCEEWYDIDDMSIETLEKPKLRTHEKDPTYPGLANPSWKEFIPKRVAAICLRSSYLQAGNAYLALGKIAEAREIYEKGFPIVDAEPRATRVDYERCSYLINLGNAHSRDGDYAKANEFYAKVEKVGEDQIQGGCTAEGMGMQLVALRARAFALNRAGKIDEGKEVLREVLKRQPVVAEETDKFRKEMMEADKKKMEEEQAKAMATQEANPAAIETN